MKQKEWNKCNQVRLLPETHRQMKVEAGKTRNQLNHMVNQILEDWLTNKHTNVIGASFVELITELTKDFSSEDLDECTLEFNSHDEMIYLKRNIKVLNSISY